MDFTDKMQWIAILAIAFGNFFLSQASIRQTKEISFIYEIFDAIKLSITKEEPHEEEHNPEHPNL